MPATWPIAGELLKARNTRLKQGNIARQALISVTNKENRLSFSLKYFLCILCQKLRYRGKPDIMDSALTEPHLMGGVNGDGTNKKAVCRVHGAMGEAETARSEIEEHV